MTKHTHNTSLYGPKTETNDKLSRLCSREQNQKVLFAERQRVVNSAFHSVPLKDISLQAVNATRQKLITGLRFLETKLSERCSTTGQKLRKTIRVHLRQTGRRTNTQQGSELRQFVSEDIFHALCMSNKGILNAPCPYDENSEA